MISTLSAIVENIANFFNSTITLLGGLDMLFFISLAVEVLIVVFFLVKSIFSYESVLNRSLEKINMWLFEKKVVTEDNIKELNMIFKTKAPKRLCYFWQQYILFREAPPSSYLSTENLIDKPLKTSSYNSNIKNLTLFTSLWALVAGMFVVLVACFGIPATGKALAMALFVPVLILLIGIVFVVYMRARKNSILNSLYQNTQLFGRFMDNACIDLPSYIDYQILFTPQEIENGQPVLREFMDYKARKEKEEFNKAREQDVQQEVYDFSATGVDGSIVLDRAMKESELYLKKKEKILLSISALESEIDSRRKNFDTVQKDYQTKLQASKENVDRLRQMSEETTNRIESNYYRKQQTQEVAKQEQLEQEFEQQRAKYLLEKGEAEEEIKKLNAELEQNKVDVETAMMSEYQTFFDKFCHSAELVVAKAFADKLNALKEENQKDKEYITELEIKLKNVPQGELDADKLGQEGQYDENGNYVYSNGTFYDKDGNFHDEKGDVYSQDGTLISKNEEKAEEKVEEVKQPEKTIVDFDEFDAFDFMTDTSAKGDVYSVAENVLKDIDNNVEVVNNTEKSDFVKETPQQTSSEETEKTQPLETVDLEESTQLPAVQETLEVVKTEEKPKKKAGRPKKIVTEQSEAKKRGRPKKVVEEKKSQPKKSVGRPKKIIKPENETQKRGRGRPKKASIEEINKRLNEEEKRISQMRDTLNEDLQSAMSEINSNNVDDKKLRRDELIKQIDSLQKEAQQVIEKHESEEKIEEINNKLESLLDQIKKLNN